MFLDFPKRDSRRILLVEVNPYQILVAQISRLRTGATVLESAAEFDRDDLDGFRAWIEQDEHRRKGRMSVICSLVPLRGMVQRERVQPAQLAKPGYLEELIHEEQKGRFLTSTPFKVARDDGWIFRTLNPVDGTALPTTGAARPALICALATSEVVEAQQRIFDLGLVRKRVEHGLMSLFGAVHAKLGGAGEARAVAIVIVLENVTAVYFLGREGVHTPNPVLFGLSSILEAGRKEFAAHHDKEVVAQLESRSPLAVAQAAKLVRRIGRDLKPVVDSFELTTGQPVNEIFCAYLPPKLHWLAEHIIQSTGRQPFPVDCNKWLRTLKLQVAPEVPTFGPHWLGALNMAVNLPEVVERKSEPGARADSAHQRPWHVDCTVPIDSEIGEFAGRRLFAALAAAAVAVLAVAITGWQLYAFNSIRKETESWENRLDENRKLFKQLNAAETALKKQSGVFDRAYDLMAEPFQLSDLMMNLGRTIPPRMRIDKIDNGNGRVAVSGTLLEPAEEASATLGRYMDELRRESTIGPLFSSIAITTLQRKSKGDEVIFELTLRLKRSTP